MKKTIVTVLAVIMAALLCLSLCACDAAGIGSIYEVYDHAKEYMTGDTEWTGPVESLTVHWGRGDVEILYHDDPRILISEKSENGLTDELRVHSWLDEGTLRVHYAASGQVIVGELKKDLTITLPAGTRFALAEVEATSGEVRTEKLTAENISLSVTSGSVSAALEAGNAGISCTSGALDLTVSARGNVKLSATSGTVSAAVQAEEILAECTSGVISLTQMGESAKAELHSTAGRISVNSEKVGTLSASSTSGTISVNSKTADTLRASSTSGRITADAGYAQKAEISCTSGTIALTAAQAPERLSLETTSGDINVFLPADASFTLSVDQTSGDFFFEGITLEKLDGKYVAGEGGAVYEMESTSGDIRLAAAR